MIKANLRFLRLAFFYAPQTAGLRPAKIIEIGSIVITDNQQTGNKL
jgi:hypothetical protein